MLFMSVLAFLRKTFFSPNSATLMQGQPKHAGPSCTAVKFHSKVIPLVP